MDNHFSYSMTLRAAGREARLRFVISLDGSRQDWRCSPADFLGASKGIVGWKGARHLGLFSDAGISEGSMAYGVLDIPDKGLDAVSIGESGDARFEVLGPGSWTLTHRSQY